jgi:lactose/cellobiose-specific phosphotransferase system IIC component
MIKQIEINNMLDKIENSFIIVLLKNTFLTIAPFLIIGAFALTFYSFPIDSWQEYLHGESGSFLRNIFFLINGFTLNILSLILVIILPLNYSRIQDPQRSALYIITSLASYCVFVCTNEAALTFDVFAPKWTFTAIIVALVSCLCLDRTSAFLRNKLPFNHYSNPGNYSINLYSILPAAAIIALFALMGQLLYVTIGSRGMQNDFSLILSGLFANLENGYLSAVLFQFFIHFMWIFGIHGNNVLESVANNMFTPVVVANQAQIAQGLEATGIFSKSFMDVFVLMGGSGAVLSLVIALLIIARKKQHRRIAASSLIPTMFNISETVVFGLPIIFNPFMAIPFILVPLISLSTAALATATGLLPVVSTSVTWTTPIIFSGYLATNSIFGSIMQIINLVLGVVVYMPFVKKIESPNRFYNEEISRLNQYISVCNDSFKEPKLLDNAHFRLRVVQSLAADLIDAIARQEITLHYQPLVTYEGQVMGAEGLLRWNHRNYDFLPPPVVVQLAKETDTINEMTLRCIRQASEDLADLHSRGVSRFMVSVNIGASQLEDPSFCESVQGIIRESDFGDNSMALEITESEVLKITPEMQKSIRHLAEVGVSIIMDDFGMGHSSISSLQELNFSYVKLDGSLVKTLDKNGRAHSIVKAVCELSEKLGYQVIGEYVETIEIKKYLYEAGCDIYQGYLYSRALPFADLKKYIRLSRK